MAIFDELILYLTSLKTFPSNFVLIRVAVRMATQLQLSNVIIKSDWQTAVYSIKDEIKAPNQISNQMRDITSLAKRIRNIVLI